jgi:hypothetical protein
VDWNNVRNSRNVRRNSRGHIAEPRLELVELCGRMRSLQKASRILACGIYRDNAPGLEVRCGYSEEHLLRSQRTAEIGSARAIAETWRQAVIAKGGFTELTGEETPAINDVNAENESLRREISELRKAGARVDPEVDAQLTQEVTDDFAPLDMRPFPRYIAAQQWFNRTRAELERANAGGQINEAAQEAMNDALGRV